MDRLLTVNRLLVVERWSALYRRLIVERRLTIRISATIRSGTMRFITKTSARKLLTKEKIFFNSSFLQKIYKYYLGIYWFLNELGASLKLT